MRHDIEQATLSQWLSASGEFSASMSVEAKTEYYLRSAIDKMKPSIIYALAKISNDQDHFADLLMQAVLATIMPSEAEGIAGEAVHSFDLNANPHSADAASLLILLAAGQAACPDDEWVRVSAMCKRVYGNLTAPKNDLLSGLLGDLGTRPVFPDCLDDEGSE